MKKIILIMLSVIVMTGCASKEYKGNGEYFQLQDRHVIYRDLTRPFSMNNAGDMETKISTPGALPR